MKNLLIVTGSRSEYGLLRNLIIEVKKSKKINSFLIATGTHLSKKYGSTLNEIKKDKLKIDTKLNLKYTKNENKNLKENSLTIIEKISQILLKKRIDMCILLGDRYEIFSSAVACILNDVKIAHIHGGELSEGSKDDVFRHSITKMSNLHFVATNEYKKRVLQMGEESKFVFKFGALCNDTIRKVKFLDKKKFLKKNNLKFDKTLLICCHPEISKKQNRILINNLLKILKIQKKINIIFTYPNSDPGSDYIIKKFKKFIKQKENSKIYKSLGHELFLQFLKNSDCIIGNSSSGIIEAPLLGTPSINIGDRQKGRLLSKTVFQCSNQVNKIKKLINKILKKKRHFNQECAYKGTNVSKKILKVIEDVKLDQLNLKKFNDI
jgi:GDP/UDP-N,N'-diacetylbacillosamine 2-epimerase (hydrolysing)